MRKQGGAKRSATDCLEGCRPEAVSNAVAMSL
jgi:hypothetical protein